MAASIGKGARKKGHDFEREVAHLLTEETGIPFKRGLGQARAGGSEYPDVHSPLLENVHIECKRQVRCNIKEAIRQGKGDIKSSLKDKSLVVITKDDREEMLVTMPFRDWIILFKDHITRQIITEPQSANATLQEQNLPLSSSSS